MPKNEQQKSYENTLTYITHSKTNSTVEIFMGFESKKEFNFE